MGTETVGVLVGLGVGAAVNIRRYCWDVGGNVLQRLHVDAHIILIWTSQPLLGSQKPRVDHVEHAPGSVSTHPGRYCTVSGQSADCAKTPVAKGSSVNARITIGTAPEAVSVGTGMVMRMAPLCCPTCRSAKAVEMTGSAPLGAVT